MALLLFAADPGRGGQDPGGGLSALLIVLVVLGIIVMAVLLFAAFHRLSRSSRGGVGPRQGEFRRGEPPFEGVARKR
jgi:hypothetical protein